MTAMSWEHLFKGYGQMNGAREHVMLGAERKLVCMMDGEWKVTHFWHNF